MSETCRSSWYADTGRRQESADREVRCDLPVGHDGDHAELTDGEVANQWPPKTVTDPTAVFTAIDAHWDLPQFEAFIAAAEARGYDRAVANLRDQPPYNLIAEAMADVSYAGRQVSVGQARYLAAAAVTAIAKHLEAVKETDR